MCRLYMDSDSDSRGYKTVGEVWALIDWITDVKEFMIHFDSCDKANVFML